MCRTTACDFMENDIAGRSRMRMISMNVRCGEITSRGICGKLRPHRGDDITRDRWLSDAIRRHHRRHRFAADSCHLRTRSHHTLYLLCILTINIYHFFPLICCHLILLVRGIFYLFIYYIIFYVIYYIILYFILF